MKRRLIVLFAFLGLPAAAQAQRLERPSTSTTTIYVDGGSAFPLGDLRDFWDWGWNVGGGIGIPVGTRLNLRIEANYSRFLLNQDKVREEFPTIPDIEGGDASATTVLGLLKLPLPVEGRSFVPYLTAGAGYMRLSVADLNVPGFPGLEASGDSDNRFAASGGAGVDIPMGSPSLAFFIEGRYTVGFGDQTQSFIPVKFGFTYRP